MLLQVLTFVFGTLEVILPTSSIQPSEIVVLVFTRHVTRTTALTFPASGVLTTSSSKEMNSCLVENPLTFGLVRMLTATTSRSRTTGSTVPRLTVVSCRLQVRTQESRSLVTTSLPLRTQYNCTTLMTTWSMTMRSLERVFQANQVLRSMVVTG